ncbi:hypothetical protein MTO96_003931 [Rhipicephalus appendiculatus]
MAAVDKARTHYMSGMRNRPRRNLVKLREFHCVKLAEAQKVFNDFPKMGGDAMSRTSMDVLIKDLEGLLSDFIKEEEEIIQKEQEDEAKRERERQEERKREEQRQRERILEKQKAEAREAEMKREREAMKEKERKMHEEEAKRERERQEERKKGRTKAKRTIAGETKGGC